MPRLKDIRNGVSVAIGRSGLMGLPSSHLMSSVRPQTLARGPKSAEPAPQLPSAPVLSWDRGRLDSR